MVEPVLGPPGADGLELRPRSRLRAGWRRRTAVWEVDSRGLAGRGGEDGFDDGCFGVGVVLDMGPGVGGEVSFGLGVPVARGGVGAEVVAEAEHAVDLG